jgi:iron complex transport system substrate-binding protein
LTVVDDDGKSVSFDRPPVRIVSLSPGHTETLYALGADGRLVATDKFSDYPPENAPKARLATYPRPNAEELVALQPDLVVALLADDDLRGQLEPRGIRVLKLYPTDFDGTLRDLELLGRVVGAEPRARQITAGMRARAEAVRRKTAEAPRPRVLYELDASDPTRVWVAGPGGFFGELVPLAGGRNVFDDLGTMAGQVSAEQVVARDPQIVVLADAQAALNPQTPEMLRARPGWAATAAVRANRIHPIDAAYLSRPGPRLVDGLEQLARLFHPELFS